MDEQLRIVVVAPDLAPSNPADERVMRQAERSRALRIGLLQHGFNLVAVLPADALLEGHLTALQPDLVIVDAESEARDTLEHVVLATREAPRPIVLFTDDEDTTHVKDAMAAGVTAYVVAGLAPQRIRPILEVALARFAHEQALRTELVQARTALHERKLIDRAKGLLMTKMGLSEPESFRWIQKTSMDRRLTMREVADAVIEQVGGGS